MKKLRNKILIVDDEKNLLEIMAEKFKREGFTTFCARDGADGLEFALRHRPDIILLDIIMPSMDGVAFLKKLREDKWGANVPVLVLSNVGDPKELEDDTPAAGPLEFLVKSNWSLEDVIKKARQTLSSSALAA